MITKSKLARISMLATLLLIVVTPAEARQTLLEDPAPVEWGCALKLKSVKEGILRAMRLRDWTAQSTSNSKIVAQVIVRGKHTLVVDIHFDNNSFDIDYKNSTNLNYAVNNGEEQIHPNANTWMSNLSTDITTALAGRCR
jgi:hypothetical protein